MLPFSSTERVRRERGLSLLLFFVEGGKGGEGVVIIGRGNQEQRRVPWLHLLWGKKKERRHLISPVRKREKKKREEGERSTTREKGGKRESARFLSRSSNGVKIKRSLSLH